MKGSVRVGMESPNLTECKPKREKTLSVIFQQHIHDPVYIRRVADEMDDPIPNRNDDNLVLIEVYQPNSHKTETEWAKGKGRSSTSSVLSDPIRHIEGGTETRRDRNGLIKKSATVTEDVRGGHVVSPKDRGRKNKHGKSGERRHTGGHCPSTCLIKQFWREIRGGSTTKDPIPIFTHLVQPSVPNLRQRENSYRSSSEQRRRWSRRRSRLLRRSLQS